MQDVHQYNVASQEFARHFEDAETSKLAHFYTAQQMERRHKFALGLPATFSAIILMWLLTSPLDKLFPASTLPFLQGVAPIILSLATAILSTLSTFLNYNDLALRHRTAAQKYQTLWRQCKNWQTDFPDATFVQQARATAKLYRDRLNEINAESPQIPRWAWMSVQKQRREGSTTYNIESLPMKPTLGNACADDQIQPDTKDTSLHKTKEAVDSEINS